MRSLLRSVRLVALPLPLAGWIVAQEPRTDIGGRGKGSPPVFGNHALERLRTSVRDGLGGIATTVGYGPRFLHSTGQLHKGGPNSIVSVQIAARAPTADLPIPGYPYDFGTLLDAQAIGDLQSLRDHGRRVLRVEVHDLKEVR